MQTLSSFPTLDTELLHKIRIPGTSFQFFYRDESGEFLRLSAEDTGSNIHPLSDDRGRWTPDIYGFGITRDYTVRCASFLYGSDGIACKDAVLALALLGKSPDSRQRFAFEIGELANSVMSQSFTLKKEFAKPCFKGRLDLQTAIVIKRAGTPMEDEKHLANMPGTVLGIVDTFSVIFDGMGSMFPINIINDKDGLLWSVDCSFDDPLFDKFTDSISININSAHKDYKYINQADKSNYNPSFLREVLAGALTTIVNFVRETDYWDDIINGQFEEESVGQAINYFVNTLNLNLDDARQCSIAFRDYLEQNLGEL